MCATLLFGDKMRLSTLILFLLTCFAISAKSNELEYNFYVKAQECTSCCQAAVMQTIDQLKKELNIDESKIKFYTLTDSQKELKIINKRLGRKFIALKKDDKLFQSLNKPEITPYDIPIFFVSRGEEVIYRKNTLNINPVDMEEVQKLSGSNSSSSLKKTLILEDDSAFLYVPHVAILNGDKLHIFDGTQSILLSIDINSGKIQSCSDLSKESESIEFYYKKPDDNEQFWAENKKNYSKLVEIGTMISAKAGVSYFGANMFAGYKLTEYEGNKAISWEKEYNIIKKEGKEFSVISKIPSLNELYYPTDVTYFNDKIVVLYSHLNYFIQKEFADIDTLIRCKVYDIKANKFNDLLSLKKSDFPLKSKDNLSTIANDNTLIIYNFEAKKATFYDKNLKEIGNYNIDTDLIINANAQLFENDDNLYLYNADGEIINYDIKSGTMKKYKLNDDMKEYSVFKILAVRGNEIILLCAKGEQWYIVWDKLQK